MRRQPDQDDSDYWITSALIIGQLRLFKSSVVEMGPI